MSFITRVTRSMMVGVFLSIALAFSSPPLRAQEAWEYSPYRIRVWLSYRPSPLLRQRVVREVESTITRHSRVLAGATWRITTEKTPAALDGLVLTSMDLITPQMIVDSKVKLDSIDKIILVGIEATASDYKVAAREYDVATQVLSAPVRQTIQQPEMLPTAVFHSAAKTFTPIARIEDVRESKAEVRVRASGLVMNEYCPSEVRVGDMLFVVIRQNDRRGVPRPDGIRVIDWTVLEVSKREGTRLECEVYTMNRAVLGARASSRVQRYALRLRLVGDSTQVKLVTKTTPPKPLVGYEIYSKNPKTDDVESIGQTDWRGILEVTRKDPPLQILYVRSGGTLLARLPIVPGQSELVTAQLLDDELRLKAESIVKAAESSLVDIVAQREMLAARIRKRLQERKTDEAETLVDELRALPTLADLRGRLDKARQNLSTDDARLRARIDKMFNDTHARLVKYIQPNLVDVLASEVTKTRSAPAPNP